MPITAAFGTSSRMSSRRLGSSAVVNIVYSGKIATGVVVTDVKDHAPAAFCQRCGVAMKLVGSIPKLGPHPELYRFECTDCGEVETKEGQG